MTSSEENPQTDVPQIEFKKHPDTSKEGNTLTYITIYITFP